MPDVARRSEPLSVLIVEDDTLQSMGYASELAKMGHAVAGQAINAAEARQLYKDKRPDLVLMDISLAGADGLDLAREMLKERRCPMIVLSAFGDQELIRRAGDAGFFGYLIKPITPGALAAQIEVAVQRFHDQEILRLEKDHLAQTLEARKLVEKAKGILMKRLNLDEPEAHKRLQSESQKRRVSLPELCKKLIESEEILSG